MIHTKSEAPRAQDGASRNRNFIYIVPLNPAYLPTAGCQSGACGTLAGQHSNKIPTTQYPYPNEFQNVWSFKVGDWVSFGIGHLEYVSDRFGIEVLCSNLNG